VLAVTEVVQAFHAAADQRGWTLDEQRISSLAHDVLDVLGMEEEYRDRHSYAAKLARPAAVDEVLEGERAREDLGEGWCSSDRGMEPPESLGLSSFAAAPAVR
jgi:hypothetical protein